jgi:hypothetical protein
MGRNLENRKKPTMIHIMKSVGLISKNIVNSVGNINDSVVMNNNLGNNGVINVSPMNILEMNSNSCS